MNVLFSSPSLHDKSIWLPYAWARFREYADRYDKYDLSNVNWLDPIYYGWDDASKLIEGINFKDVDVLLLSLYVWNEERQLEIAEIAKKENPAIVVLAGGPQAKYKPHQDLTGYEYIDFVTPYEGEEVVSEVLGRLMYNIPLDDYELIVSPKVPVEYVKPQRLNLSNSRSPLELYKDDFKRMTDEAKQLKLRVGTPLETNRGCPYKCTFCDWGSATADKIRRFSYDTVIEDINAIGDIGSHFVFVTDANYGIFDVDLDYVEKLIQNKNEKQLPEIVMFLSAKNKKTISNKAHKALYNAKMLFGAEIGFQHTDADVLSSIVRSNIKMEKMKEEIAEMLESNIPISAALIIGNPGDTTSKWKKAIDDMLDLGFHDDLKIFDFMLLPNAPAASPAYIKKHNITSIKRYGSTEIVINMRGRSEHGKYLADFISSCSTFTEDDYIDMQTYSTLIQSLHVMNITRFIAMFMKHYYDVKYQDFYTKFSNTPSGIELNKLIRENYEEYVKGSKLHKFMEHEGILINSQTHAKLLAVQMKEELFNDVKGIIKEVAIDLSDEMIDDLIEAQKATIVSWEGPYEANVKYNFMQIFKSMLGMSPLQEYVKMTITLTNETTIQSKTEIVGPVYDWQMSRVRSIKSWLRNPSTNPAHNVGGGNYYKDLLL